MLTGRVSEGGKDGVGLGGIERVCEGDKVEREREGQRQRGKRDDMA